MGGSKVDSLLLICANWHSALACANPKPDTKLVGRRFVSLTQPVDTYINN